MEIYMEMTVMMVSVITYITGHLFCHSCTMGNIFMK